MRIGVCLSGALRTFAECAPSIARFFGDADYFGLFWTPQDGDPSEEEVRNLLPFTRSSFVEQPSETLEDAVHANGYRFKTHNAGKMFYGIEAALGVLEEHERESGSTYDLIFRCRPDVLLRGTIDAFRDDLQGEILFANHSRYRGFCDQFFGGPASTMKIAMRSYQSLREPLEEPFATNAESVLKSWVERHGLPAREVPFDFKLLRPQFVGLAYEDIPFIAGKPQPKPFWELGTLPQTSPQKLEKWKARWSDFRIALDAGAESPDPALPVMYHVVGARVLRSGALARGAVIIKESVPPPAQAEISAAFEACQPDLPGEDATRASIDRPVIAFWQDPSSGVAGWFIDTLPKMLMVASARQYDRVPFLLPSIADPHHKLTLAALFPDREVLVIPSSSTAAPWVYFPSHVETADGELPAWAGVGFAALRRAWGLEDTLATSKIVLAPIGTTRKKLRSDPAVSALINAEGLRVVPSGGQIDGYARECSGAAVVYGFYDVSLLNIGFCARGTHVVIVKRAGEDDDVGIFPALAERLGLSLEVVRLGERDAIPEASEAAES